MMHIFNPNTQEAERGGSVGHLIYTEFQESQGYIQKPCLKLVILTGGVRELSLEAQRVVLAWPLQTTGRKDI